MPPAPPLASQPYVRLSQTPADQAGLGRPPDRAEACSCARSCSTQEPAGGEGRARRSVTPPLRGPGAATSSARPAQTAAGPATGARPRVTPAAPASAGPRCVKSNRRQL